jgi:outer membrane protein OmpA-like peptidoglycan-associated protein
MWLRTASRIAVGFAAGICLLDVTTARAQDLTGTKDHAAISRYAGSIIIGYDVREFDELAMPLESIQVTYPPAPPKKVQRAEGRVTRIVYLAPEGRSTLEVLRNYQMELQKGGFTTLFTCGGTAACSTQSNGLTQFLYPMTRSQMLKGQDLPLVLTMPQDERYLAARRASRDGNIAASVFVARDTNPGVPRSHNRAVVLLEIVESTPMEAGLVTVDAAAMAAAIAETGHVAVYGILFDTNRADVKAESQPALKEVAALMTRDATLSLLIVGHTDNVGGYDANVTLSQRRAEAVFKELTSTHGVAPSRLRAVGVGMAAPVASNANEDGRAKNRRVELVRQ